ncbi:MAG: hypothetical protein Q8885_00585 [Candidatus Phytoplasma stylosanthis]|nr:hypothetical protein [Candidatus Phytoplasma stylosanthis]
MAKPSTEHKINLEDLTLGQKDITLSFHAPKMLNLLQNYHFSPFQKEKINKDFSNHLFFF